jgi:nicotinate-nucleotide adenylyltransferase
LSRLGVFGGTFDPVHHGHLILAQEAQVRLKLDRVLFVPANTPSHKRAPGLAPVAHRIAMLRLATRGRRGFQVSTLEAERGGRSYTVTTLEALRRTHHGEIFFLMGQDSLREFRTWVRPARILELARLAVVARGEEKAPSIPRTLRGRVVLVPFPLIGISSTEIRRRIRRGLPVRYWTPDPVIRYVQRHGLYRSGNRRR